MSTTFVKAREIDRQWYVVDAKDQVLGRLASRIAQVLRGKHKPTFTPFLDTGDHIIVVNAEKVVLTGKKEEQKLYFHHSGYPGGLKRKSAQSVRAKYPERLIEEAVRGMLPKNRLGRAQFRKLKVYAGPDHPHQAQQPRPLESEEGPAGPLKPSGE
jgi:large subunit ribosomal protein L13